MLEFFRLPTGRVAPGRRSTPTSFQPGIEVLEERAVPAAAPLTIVDLTTAGAKQEVNGALFQQTDTQPTGTGVIHSFVRLQAHGKNAVAQGVNTDARPLQMDENNSPVFTRSLQLSEIPIVTIDGVAYREFLLDINQKASSPILSLDEVRMYVGTSGNLNGYNATTKQFAGLDPIYDLDTTTRDNSVRLNGNLTHGSGSGDMFLYIPVAAFSGSSGNYLYLYSKFGATKASNGGFEEWAVRTPNAPPALASLSGFVYFDADTSFSFEEGETGEGADSGLPQVTLILRGTNDLGETVEIQVQTNMNGFYSFDNLRPGEYSITEYRPANYSDGAQTVGTVNGTPEGDATISLDGYMMFENITVFGGMTGLHYDFGHLLSEEPPPGT